MSETFDAGLSVGQVFSHYPTNLFLGVPVSGNRFDSAVWLGRVMRLWLPERGTSGRVADLILRKSDEAGKVPTIMVSRWARTVSRQDRDALQQEAEAAVERYRDALQRACECQDPSRYSEEATALIPLRDDLESVARLLKCMGWGNLLDLVRLADMFPRPGWVTEQEVLEDLRGAVSAEDPLAWWGLWAS